MMKRVIIILLLLMSATGVGCQTDGGPRAARSTTGGLAFDNLYLSSSPAPLNLDSEPGADGLKAKVYAFKTGLKAVPITSGKLDLLLFEGTQKDSKAGNSKIIKVWSYTPEDLKAVAFRSYAGIVYNFELRWGKEAPTGGSITLIARYLSNTGKSITSAPVTLRLRSRK